VTRIVAIGEAMVEMAPRDTAGTYQMGFAGDAMNTAWYLRQLLPETDQVDFLTAVGTDAVSDQLVAFLNNARIGTACVRRVPDLTVGLYMIQLSDGERSFSYWRGQSAARGLAQDRQALASALGGAEIAYFSGITIAILLQKDREQFLEVLRDFRASGGQVVFDPNLRPRLWDNSETMMQAVMQAASVSDVILPSHEDEAAYFGDMDSPATAKRYEACGADTVIVKNGPGDMVSLTAGSLEHHAPVLVSQVIDTTAAGDSFNAGFLASRLSGQPIGVAVTAGATLAARVIQKRGALV
jgi:2-dehydro-3-deoxygluconokinase